MHQTFCFKFEYLFFCISKPEDHCLFFKENDFQVRNCKCFGVAVVVRAPEICSGRGDEVNILQNRSDLKGYYSILFCPSVKCLHPAGKTQFCHKTLDFGRHLESYAALARYPHASYTKRTIFLQFTSHPCQGSSEPNAVPLC